ncbi:protein tramtrack, beta isoform-like isoform X4 [Maniola jurtina]|uniref:protein tramtrack, beta isoform-like isoform X4 n=1 Tax=Maniola jurtina TaxID=191418 RepID=UPI001E68AFDB|nr:protein tramtrack, beta isoform-like isoform X4 [Maniola jurtina]
MAMPEQFSLRWNDFHANLSQSFQALLEGEDLVDVTLAAGGQYVHAHKLILSVCSPYFKELFKMNPCEHPIVILKDVAHQELRQLLQFMYRGEVHVRTQELSAFLHTAELLQVKGLTGGRERSESPPAPLEDDSLNARPTPPEPVSDSLPEWVPSGEEAITPEVPQESVSSLVPKDEAARSPLKRLLKNTTNKNSYNIKKKPRPVSENSPSLVENTEYASDGVQNMVGNKWRTDANADLSSVDNVQNMVGNKWRSDANADLRDVDNVQNLVENKWRSDVNADLRDVDNYPASGQLEAKYQPPAETQSPVAAEAALPKVEANLETV